MSQAYLSHSGKYQTVQRHRHTPDWIHSSVQNSKMVELVVVGTASVVKLKHIAGDIISGNPYNQQRIDSLKNSSIVKTL